jgi:hypothetical protein
MRKGQNRNFDTDVSDCPNGKALAMFDVDYFPPNTPPWRLGAKQRKIGIDDMCRPRHGGEHRAIKAKRHETRL